MRKTSAANSEASSPPAPARISSEDVLVVVGVLGQQEELEALGEFGDAGFEFGDLDFGHLAQFGVLLGEHGTGLVEVGGGFLVVAVGLDHLFEVAVGLGGFAVGFGVGDDGRVGHL
jgi:hypothetical protein